MLDVIRDGSFFQINMNRSARKFSKRAVSKASKEFGTLLPDSKEIGLLAGRQMGLLTSQSFEVSSFILSSRIKVSKVGRLRDKAVGTVGLHSKQCARLLCCSNSQGDEKG